MFYNYHNPTVTYINESGEINLAMDMRSVWEQHVWWTRNLLISIIDSLSDKDIVEKRLLQNPSDIARIYGKFYGPAVEQKIAQLFTQHLQIGGQIMQAAKEGQSNKVATLEKQWKQNADAIADYLSFVVRKYDMETVRKMLYTHLDLTTSQVVNRLARNHVAEVQTFDQIEREALMMADYFAKGIAKDKF